MFYYFESRSFSIYFWTIQYEMNNKNHFLMLKDCIEILSDQRKVNQFEFKLFYLTISRSTFFNINFDMLNLCLFLLF